MPAEVDLARIAGLLADRSRAAMLLAMFDGRAWTAGELARAAEIAPSTASEHLARLLTGGLTTVVTQGRHRYFRLAGTEIAEAIEPLLQIAPPTPVTSLRAASRGRALAAGRTCYDHLAGRAGVALADALRARGIVTDDPALTPVGRDALTEFGVDVADLARGRRPLVRDCLDWTERRSHLAGAVGAALTERLFALEWLTRVGSGRGVRVTEAGKDGLRTTFGMAPLPEVA
ncbi:winged helix-turn-helix domain-containing protein [Actinopolymorpha singaporensis]|uniref:DNA-binding transcriptional regulator, ArsR family n=1 Tax=Actinopolymorpha singaporensis TaxID=117157 RepID=A0A1H1N2M6_9ACTN|nr:winged helix-turn-helix domain-containing protein [Actinopolymorpha singaporensis]SDR92439.1 DNA-binding transcriptional regulator, ArsR family [Actinopolymorpha singaporensis]